MKIAVNTRLLLKNRLEGIGVFAYETLKRITVNHPEHEFIFLFDRSFNKDFIFSNNITPVVIPPQARHPALFYIWFEYSVARAIQKHQADLLFSPEGYLSLRSPVRSINTIHDLNFEHDDYGISFLNRNYFRYFFPKYARKASRIVTVSEFSKMDIITRYGIDEQKIDIVPNASSEGFIKLDESAKEKVRIKYSSGNPYFLYVGSIHPRKNISNLLLSFEQFRNQSSLVFNLILAGNKSGWNSEMQKVYDTMKHKSNVIFTGRVDHEELCNITASAFASMNISRHEGFGIPILEAMSCGVPVISSDVTALPEIAGGASLLINPDSVPSIAEAMQKIAADSRIRKELIEKGIVRNRDFSWDRSAESLWRSIEKTSES